MKFNKDDMDKAVQIWEEGLRKYPNSALLKVKLGWASYNRWLFGWTADAQREGQTAIRYAQEALAANRSSLLAAGLAHWLRGDLYGDVEGDYERAVGELRIASKLMPVEIGPKIDPTNYLILGGKPDEAITELNWLTPDGKSDRLLAPGFCNLGLAHFVKKEYTGAVENILGLPIDMNFPAWCLSILTASYVQLGQVETAKDVVKKIRAIDPTWTVELFRRANNMSDKEALGRLIDSVRQAGLPEI